MGKRAATGVRRRRHCDRFWAKALRHHAAMKKESTIGAFVIDDGRGSGSWSGGYTSAASISEGLRSLFR